MDYNKWLEFTFCLRDPTFCLDSPAEFPGSSAEAAEHLRYFFLHAVESAAVVPAEKLKSGLWVIPSIDGYGGLLSSPEVPLGLRQELVDAHLMLYQTLFWSGGFDGAAFMWWEHLIGAEWRGGPPVWRDKKICDCVVMMLGRTLSLESEECQRDALHGLNEFGSSASDGLAESLIKRFLESEEPISSEIRRYAQEVLDGQAQ